MTGQQIIDFFRGLVDDELDVDFELQLLNGAKEKVEGDRDWEFLKKLDNSKSATSSGILLPSDYSRTKIIYVGSVPYDQIPFEQKPLFANSSNCWYLDFLNNMFYLLGTNLSGTVNHYYIYKTPDIALNTSPVWPRAHQLLAYEMAELYYTIDQGDRNFAWDDKHAIQKELYRRSLVDWDAAIQSKANANAAQDDTDYEMPLGLM